MRDYEDRWGRGRRDRDESNEYARREYEYRGGGTGGWRQDMESGRDRGYGRQERAHDRGANFAHGMMDDMRRYARGDYDRDDDRSSERRRRDYGGDYGEDRSYGHERDRSMGGRGYRGGYAGGYGGDYARDRPGYGERDRDDNDRGFLERAGDEVASWFGDDDAQRRRRMDEQRSHRGRGPRGYSRSDDRIREDVSDRLTEDHYVDASDVDITVSNGEVTLSGHVDDRRSRRRAEDIAESVSGVTHVQNNLRVRQSGGMGSGMGSGTSAGASAMAGMGSKSGDMSGGTTTSTATTGGTTAGGTGATGGAASATDSTGGKMRT